MSNLALNTRLIAYLGSCIILSSNVMPAIAQTGDGTSHNQAVQSPVATLSVTVGTGKLIRLTRSATTIFMADPQIADIQTPKADRVFVFGKKTGRTT